MSPTSDPVSGQRMLSLGLGWRGSHERRVWEVQCLRRSGSWGTGSWSTVTRGMEAQAGTAAGCSKWTEASAWGPWLLMSTDGKAPSSTQTQDGRQEWTRQVWVSIQTTHSCLGQFRRRGALGEGWAQRVRAGGAEKWVSSEPSSTWDPSGQRQLHARAAQDSVKAAGAVFQPLPTWPVPLCCVQPAQGHAVTLDTGNLRLPLALG